MTRGENAAQNLLRLRPIFSAVATPSFPRNHGGPQGALGCVIGGFDAGTMKKGEQPRLFMPQMLGQPPIGGIAKRLGQ